MKTIAPRLDLRQSQNLVMTPQLQQAIKLLQMTNAELTSYIESEVAQNPLLEKIEGDESGPVDADTENKIPAAEKDDITEDFDQGWTGNEKEAAAPPADFDPGSAMAGVGAGGHSSFDNPEGGFENTLTRQTSLRDHLLEQLNLSFEDGRDRLIGAQIIDMIDEAGYLRDDPADLAARMACAPERLDRILMRLRQFTPVGIFARDLKDCLMLQAEDQGRLDDPMRTLLENLPLLAAHDHAALAKICGVNDTYLRDMIAEVKALNPRPAADFDHIVVQTALPDVLMKRLPKSMGGGWRVELNNDTLPRVLVNQTYYTEVAGHARDKKDKEYLSQQLQNAHWLVKAMDQRARTILKVSGEIVEHQDAFFLFGIEYLKPLTLREVAEKIDMHESTVSRVTSNKYIGTPRGIFELKYFFSTALGEGDDAHAAEAVKARIKNMIDQEDPKKILSDDTIAEKLKAGGVDIARRTVAKYREEMHIPSSVQRRRQKK